MLASQEVTQKTPDTNKEEEESPDFEVKSSESKDKEPDANNEYLNYTPKRNQDTDSGAKEKELSPNVAGSPMEGSFVNIDQTDMQQDADNPYFLEGEDYA